MARIPVVPVLNVQAATPYKQFFVSMTGDEDGQMLSVQRKRLECYLCVCCGGSGCGVAAKKITIYTLFILKKSFIIEYLWCQDHYHLTLECI